MYNTPLEWKCLDNYTIRNALRVTAETETPKDSEHFGTEKPIAYTLFYEKKKRKLTRQYKTIFSFHGYSSSEMSKQKQKLFTVVHYLCCCEKPATNLTYKS